MSYTLCYANCDKRAKSKGLCDSHYMRLLRTGSVQAEKPLRKMTKRIGVCSVFECGLEIEARGLCERHYVRMRKYGDPLIGKDSKTLANGRRKDGEGHLDNNGYIQIYKPNHPNAGRTNGIILEHRYVMSEYLKRSLRDGETIHHINGVRNDNRIENLELWTSNHPKSTRASDLLIWAKEIIKIYG